MGAQSIDSYRPLGDTHRIDALDVARGFALLGILIMNATGMALMDSAYFNPAVDGGNAGADLWAWLFMVIYAEASMRTLFSTLFGAGMVLFLERLEQRQGGLQPVDVHARRMLWLLGFGLLNTFVILYPYDILQLYAIAGLLLFPFRMLSARGLFLLAAGFFALAMLWDSLNYFDSRNSRIEYETLVAQQEAGATLDEEQLAQIEYWEDDQAWRDPDESMRAEKREMRGASNPLTLWRNLAGDYLGFYTDSDFWRYLLDAVAAIALGMALYRAGIMSGQTTARTYWVLLLVGYGVGLGLGYWRARALIDSGYDFFAFEPHFMLYHLRRIGLGLGHLALIHLLSIYDVFAVLRRVLASIGRMALTNYLTQSVLLVLAFYGGGFSLHQQISRFEVLYIVAGIWVFQAVASMLWLRGYRFGPLEWLWRSLTYWQRQPFRRS